MDYPEKENIILSKTYDYAVKIVKLHQYLYKEKKEFELSKQILRSGLPLVPMSKKQLADFPKKIFWQNLALPIKKHAKRAIGSDF